MSETEPRAGMPLLNWSELGVSDSLPTGTVTLLLADVEGSTRLWETQPDQMSAAVTLLDQTLCDVVAEHRGVRPVEQGEGDSFVVAFARASDAVACALALQRAPLAPIRLRIGLHTGEIQLRDEGNYVGSTVNRTARLRDLAHGGQTVLSGATEPMVVDRLPADTWLTDLGTHLLRDLPRPERVVQLCHSDLHNEFPPLRVSNSVVAQRLPVQVTRFVGRTTEIAALRHITTDKRLVTLTGAGGTGKTRLAVQLATEVTDEFVDGVWYVDLAPITDPDVVPVAAARALGLPDQQGRSTMDTLTRFLGDRHVLVVLDNCEHLLNACATLVDRLLASCPQLTLLTTSREPIGVAGELTWQVPSLSLDDEAIELFADRARHVRPDFVVTDDNAAAVTEICRRLDGMPLAIELAAARVRALQPAEIVDSLHDCFRLLTGGARTAVRRQQTLRASVDWSHALLTEPERVLFRRLAVFLGGFDLDAAQAVGGSGGVERYQVLDQLSLLVDKSLVVAENRTGTTRYRLLETVRQYALEKLAESGEGEVVRARHRDHYTAMAARLDTPAAAGDQRHIEQVETEIDNLRAAFAWSRDNSDIDNALQLASSLQPLWLGRGRIREGLAWLEAVLSDENVDRPDMAVAYASALADRVVLASWVGGLVEPIVNEAGQALAIAREVGDPALLVRALTACCYVAAFDVKEANPYLAEAIDLAREIGDGWRLSQILQRQANGAVLAGDPAAALAAGEEGRDLADAIGDRFGSRQCRWPMACAQFYMGDLAGAEEQFRELAAEAEADHDAISRVTCLMVLAYPLAHRGAAPEAATAASAAIEGAAELDPFYVGACHISVLVAALAAGDVALAADAAAAAWPLIEIQPQTAAVNSSFIAEAALATGDLPAARRWADNAIEGSGGWWVSRALETRARVAIALGEPEQAERDAYDALARAAEIKAHFRIAGTLEILAGLAAGADSHREAARLLGAADGIRRRTGEVRFKVYDAAYEKSVGELRDAMDDNDFDATWAEGAALSTDEAIAYAQRGRGERKRPSSGWTSLTPTELDVVRLVSEGLSNSSIATRLFVSPRTVQTHLTHVYNKLGLTSRVQLAQEAVRHR